MRMINPEKEIPTWNFANVLYLDLYVLGDDALIS